MFCNLTLIYCINYDNHISENMETIFYLSLNEWGHHVPLYPNSLNKQQCIYHSNKTSFSFIGLIIVKFKKSGFLFFLPPIGWGSQLQAYPTDSFYVFDVFRPNGNFFKGVFSRIYILYNPLIIAWTSFWNFSIN